MAIDTVSLKTIYTIHIEAIPKLLSDNLEEQPLTISRPATILLSSVVRFYYIATLYRHRNHERQLLTPRSKACALVSAVQRLELATYTFLPQPISRGLQALL